MFDLLSRIAHENNEMVDEKQNFIRIEKNDSEGKLLP
jgi:hypothetical protein